MARESQGLQILLIVFVVLAVVLGVTTYLSNKRADEATKSAAAATQAKSQSDTEKAAAQEDTKAVKALIGYGDDISTDELKKHYNDDMARYSADKTESDKALSDADKQHPETASPASKVDFSADAMHYGPLLERMANLMRDRSDELIRMKNLLAEQELRFKNREDAKTHAYEAITKDYTTTAEEFKRIASDYVTTTAATAANSSELVSKLTTIQKSAAGQVSKATDAEKAARIAAQQAEKERAEADKKLHQLQTGDMPANAASGAITWVSDSQRAVWINRGQADSLQRGTKFSVYSADSTDAAKAVKKGTVEVTKIDGDHSAMARILDDKLADPIMAGDKVFTPLWSPGQRNHFALTGIMNLDGDGHNQINIVRGLIVQNGGAVDCELDEQGHKQGQITNNTNFIVVGDSPDKSSPETMKNHAEILREAEHDQVKKMTLSEFKQQMGYQKSSSVEHFGAATTGDVGRAASAVKTARPPAKAPAEATP